MNDQAIDQEKIEALQVKAHQLAKEGDFQKALGLLDSLQNNHHITTWDTVFYTTFYRYAPKGQEKNALAHIPQLSKAVVDTFALVLSQNLDILETLVCFQDIYDQIWDLSSRLQQYTHKEYIGTIKGKSVTEDFYQSQTTQYIENLTQILALSENFLNALGNLSEFTIVNPDLLWDFFQNNDGLFSFLLAYTNDPTYEKKRNENIQIIHLKRPNYPPEPLPTKIQPAELRSPSPPDKKKKSLFQKIFRS